MCLFLHFFQNDDDDSILEKTETSSSPDYSPQLRFREDSDVVDDDDPYVEAEDEGDFVPSKIAPQPILPDYNPGLRFQRPPTVSDSAFGVSVTPINVDAVSSKEVAAFN